MNNQQLRIVGACDHNRVIGHQNRLPWHIPEELQHFKQETEGTSVVVGRKTFENIFPVVEGLDREFIVLTKTEDYDNVKIASDIDSAISKATRDQINFIGGEYVFELAQYYVDEIKLSVIHNLFEGDRFFPKIKRGLWKVKHVDDHKLDRVSFSVYTFIRNTLDFKENYSSKFAVPEFIRLDNIRS